MCNSEHLISSLLSGKNLPIVMGILNITPDSFSDGNEYNDLSKSLKYVHKMIKQGASIIDVGGESTRPGAEQISIQEELDRILPVIKSIRENSTITISVDTRNAEVAEKAILAGANIVNDISALRHDENMLKVLQKYQDVGIILMHMQGKPETMQQNPAYADVVSEIVSFFKERIDYCLINGICSDRIMIDPGIGFGKNLEHNLSILANLEAFKVLGLPIVMGASRKRFINDISPSDPSERLGGSLGTTLLALEAGIDVVRVHDVHEHVQFLNILKSVKDAKEPR